MANKLQNCVFFYAMIFTVHQPTPRRCAQQQAGLAYNFLGLSHNATLIVSVCALVTAELV